MSIIVPTVTAYSEHDYHQQLQKLRPFTQRIHIDLMDGDFAPSKSLDIADIHMPAGMTVDIHLMFERPMDVLEQLIQLKPSLVVIHNEAHIHHMHFAAELHRHNIKAGLALLQDTPVHFSQQIMHSFDHVLVFSGKLGRQGGTADLTLLSKVQAIRAYWPDAEIGWDGGINADNAGKLVKAGVDVLNVGGFIAHDDSPQSAYEHLVNAVSA